MNYYFWNTNWVSPKKKEFDNLRIFDKDSHIRDNEILAVT